MIIFYKKKTGEIVGTIEGRIHPEDHLKMWIGSKEENERLVVDWEFIEAETEEGGTGAGVWQPTAQKELFENLDKDPSKIRDYKVNLDTKELELK